jgi:hypothetical protein
MKKNITTNETETRVINAISKGTHEENALCVAAGLTDNYPDYCQALWTLQRAGLIVYIDGAYYLSDDETREREAATADRIEKERETRHEVETIDEKTTRQCHLTAAEVIEKCQKLADLMADFYGCHLIASDMVLSCQEFAGVCELLTVAPFYFAIRKQGTESGTREYCRERCRVLGRPVYVLKVESEVDGLFTLTARVDPVEREAREKAETPAAPADIESEAETITAAAPAADSLAAKVADVARVWLLCCCLTAAAPAAADSIETDTPADVCELLTADPLAQVAEFAAAGLTVSHVTIKSLPARELPAADVPALLTC